MGIPIAAYIAAGAVVGLASNMSGLKKGFKKGYVKGQKMKKDNNMGRKTSVPTKKKGGY